MDDIQRNVEKNALILKGFFIVYCTFLWSCYKRLVRPDTLFTRSFTQRERAVETNIKVKFIISEINGKWFLCNLLKNQKEFNAYHKDIFCDSEY